MKIRPVILCGGAGTRLWPDKKKHQAKQFIDFGGWSLIQKTLERVNKPIFDFPIISTNLKYLKQVKQALKKSKIKKFKIVLEPAKKNTAPAILASALIKDIPLEQPLMFFAADHLIERSNILNKSLLKNKPNLDNQNLFIKNDLQLVVENENDSVKQALYLLSKLENCLTFSMSGSGPTCFALFKDIEIAKKELTANYKLFRNKGYDSWVCTFLEKGITFI